MFDRQKFLQEAERDLCWSIQMKELQIHRADKRRKRQLRFQLAWGELADFKHFNKTLKGNAVKKRSNFDYWLNGQLQGVGHGRTWILLFCTSKEHKAKFNPQTSKPGFMGLMVQNHTGGTQQQTGAVPGHHLESSAPGSPSDFILT